MPLMSAMNIYLILNDKHKKKMLVIAQTIYKGDIHKFLYYKFNLLYTANVKEKNISAGSFIRVSCVPGLPKLCTQSAMHLISCKIFILKV